MIRQAAQDQADLIRRGAATGGNYSPDFACPIAVANLQQSARYYADGWAQQVLINAELLIALDAERRKAGPA